MIWIVEQIKCGRKVRSKSRCHVHTIGWNSPHKEKNKYVLISDEDGGVLQIGTKTEMVEHLNKHGYTPEISAKNVVDLHIRIGSLTGMHKTLREATATCVRSGSMNTAADLVKVLELVESLISIRLDDSH